MCDIKSEKKFERLEFKAKIRPKKYLLKLHPDFKLFNFTGSVVIDLEIDEEECEFIELNSSQLSLTSAKFRSDNCEVNSDKFEYFEKYETVKIFFYSNKIKHGNGKLEIEFTGKINENLQGFYKTKCLQRDGSVSYAAVTQFETTYARKAFPCFDEPSLKATFSLVVVADKSKTVLSNMPVKEIHDICLDKNDLAEFYFEESPIMSTYLLALVIGDYDYVEGKDNNGTLIRVYTPVGKSETGNFTLQLSLKTLEFFAEYFDLKYPLPKLDLIALQDVEIEAMENWGLITFKESLILVDENNYSVESKFNTALTVCHEIGHQWFGNIVTMKWWTDLWLNEGFATWIEYLCVNHCLPEWKIWNYYANEHLLRALELDSLESSHAIEVEVGPPEEIYQIFDSISYCKGSAVIRMLNDFMGDASFAGGLRIYLKEYQYKNAATNDLWEQLSKASGKNIKDLMQNWTRQSGYPLVEVVFPHVEKRVDSEGNLILSLSQKKFYKNPNKAKQPDDSVWKIPIRIKTKLDQNVYLMSEKNYEINLGKVARSDLILINSEYAGFFRVKYSDEMFDVIIQHLNDLSTLDKIALITDTFALCWSNSISAFDLMRLVWQFRDETDSYVWCNILKNLHQFHKPILTAATDLNEKFELFLNSLFENIKKKMGYELRLDEDEPTKLMHQNLLYYVAKLNRDESFKQFANNSYTSRFAQKIPFDLQKSVYSSVLADADENRKIIDEFMQMYSKSESPEEKERIIFILAEVKSDALIEEILNLSLSPDITYEESVYLLVSIAQNSSNKKAVELTWNFIMKNWKLIYSRFCDSVLLGRLLKPVIQNFISIDDILIVENFFRDNSTPQADQSVKQAIEDVNSKISWLNNQIYEIKRFLDLKFN